MSRNCSGLQNRYLKPMKVRIYIITIVTSALLLVSCHDRRASDDQGRTSACWIYAMLTCIEREAALHGDSITLSRQWLMAKELEEQTEWAYFNANANLNHCCLSMRGVGPEAIRLIERYGLIPYQNEKTEITNSSVLERKLTLLARQALSLDDLHDRMKALLPQFTLSPHGAFYYLSMRYNPYQFAESIMYRQHWQFITSVSYREYGTTFPLEVADNSRHHEYLNMPIDSLTSRVMTSLRAGHAVYWEYGKRTADGLVTSDHAMAIVGLRKSKEGKTMLLCKNSYGKEWGRNGTCLVSIDDFKKKTSNVGVLLDE